MSLPASNLNYMAFSDWPEFLQGGPGGKECPTTQLSAEDIAKFTVSVALVVQDRGSCNQVTAANFSADGVLM